MLRKKILIILSTILIITSVGCGNKSKDAGNVNDNQSVVEENIEKEDEDTKPEDNSTADETTKPEKPVESVTKPETSKPEVAKPETPKPQPPKQETVKPTAPKPEEKPTPKPEEKSVATKDIADKIVKDLEFPATLEMDEERAKEFYALDTTLVSEFAIYQAMMNVKSDEVSVFKVKDKKNIEKVKEGILKRQEQLTNVWKQYLPDQYEKVQNYIILEKDNYIMYCISDNQEKAEEIFNSFFSK